MATEHWAYCWLKCKTHCCCTSYEACHVTPRATPRCCTSTCWGEAERFILQLPVFMLITTSLRGVILPTHLKAQSSQLRLIARCLLWRNNNDGTVGCMMTLSSFVMKAAKPGNLWEENKVRQLGCELHQMNLLFRVISRGKQDSSTSCHVVASLICLTTVGVQVSIEINRGD